MGPVVGVVGGSGGVGASTFAAVLAAVAGGSVLIDVDVAGGGVDVLLGIERTEGARWSDLHLAGGRLEPETLIGGLPRWGPCAVLAADTLDLEAEAVLQVVEVARQRAPVVLDLPRSSCPERAAALVHCDLVVVVTRADPAGLVAAHAVVGALPEVPVGAVVRRAVVPAHDAARLVRARLLGELPATTPGFELRIARLPRSVRVVASGVLAGMAVAA
jgi:MinD-like ATPase involved in chromosome partitioning or flagellar assembly